MLVLPLNTLKFQHKTIYRYSQPVSIGLHRLMLRPRESRDLRPLTCEILVVPAAVTTRAKGVFGNAVAIATFESTTDSLTIES